MNDAIGYEQMRRYLLYVNDVPAAKAVTFCDDETVVGIYGVGTSASSRGKGLASVLMRFVLAKVPKSVRTVALQSTPMAVGLYRRLGFTACCQIPTYLGPSRSPHQRFQVM
jgi:ribosomal protein S18 acetylase RimI-like enzyme